MHLSPHEIRVLGVLIEKEIATPELYPLSLNSLQAAANQRSSRDPVLDLSEEEIRQALHALEDLGLVRPTRDSRVAKYEHRARTVLNLRRDETAILCLLLLRGPQTPGELRSRADRLHTFDDLAAVTATLDRLASRPPISPTDQAPTDRATDQTPDQTGPLTTLLPRHPGARESRYAHLLGDLREAPAPSPPAPIHNPRDPSPLPAHSLAALHAELLNLRETISSLDRRISHIEHSLSVSPAGE